MRQIRPYMAIMVLALFLVGSPPCQGDDTPPSDADTTSGVQLRTVPDVTVGPIIYQGPTIADATVGSIVYQGPTIADATVGPIQFSGDTIAMRKIPKHLVPEAQTIKPAGRKSLALKKINTVPVIVAPAENQHMASPGTLLLKVRLLGEEPDPVWAVEYKPFGTQRFTAGRQQLIASPLVGSGNTYSGKLKLDKPGKYRLKVRANAPGAPWSQWRTVIVGKAPAVESSKKALLKNTTETDTSVPGIGGVRVRTPANN